MTVADIILEMFGIEDKKINHRFYVNSIVFFLALPFCIQRDLKSFGKLGIVSFICVIYLVLIILVEFPSYYNHYNKIAPSIKYIGYTVIAL